MRGSVAKGKYLLVLTLAPFLPFRSSVLMAQEPVKAHVMGDPMPGREAPAFSLPYLTAEGPGPADRRGARGVPPNAMPRREIRL